MNLVAFYEERKKEDLIFLNQMFSKLYKINPIWGKRDFKNTKEFVDSVYNNEKLNQFIFWGFQYGYEKLFKYLKSKYPNVKIKVICNTSNALLYYDYERNNLINMLNMSKEGYIDNIAFLKNDMYECYRRLGYKVSLLKENFVLDSRYNINRNNSQSIGIYSLSYTWDKNIFNQLSSAPFLSNNYKINTIILNDRMKDFLKVFNISVRKNCISDINLDNLLEELSKNIVNIACSFTDYFHTVALISLELGIPCIIGNHSNLFNAKLNNYLVVDSEDDFILISEKVRFCIKNRDEIIKEYKNWKKEYNIEAKKSIVDFLDK